MFVILGEMVFACRGILIFSTWNMTAKALKSMAMEYNLGVKQLNLGISALSTSLYIGPRYQFKPCFLICKIKWLSKIMLKNFFILKIFSGLPWWSSVRWVGVCMSMQGMPVNPWFEKIPHAAKQLSLCITTTKLFLCPHSARIDNTYGPFLVLGRSPGKRNYYPFQYSCLENSMDRGAWQAIIHGVTRSPTQLKD